MPAKVLTPLVSLEDLEELQTKDTSLNGTSTPKSSRNYNFLISNTLRSFFVDSGVLNEHTSLFERGFFDREKVYNAVLKHNEGLRVIGYDKKNRGHMSFLNEVLRSVGLKIDSRRIKVKKKAKPRDYFLVLDWLDLLMNTPVISEVGPPKMSIHNDPLEVDPYEYIDSGVFIQDISEVGPPQMSIHNDPLEVDPLKKLDSKEQGREGVQTREGHKWEVQTRIAM